MTRKRFLMKLYNNLKWNLPVKDANEVIEDYSEYFDEELAIGKTEQQFCLEVGEPKQIAANILKERNASIKFYLGGFRIVAVIAILMFYPVIWASRNTHDILYWHEAWLQYAYVLIMPPLIVYLIGYLPLKLNTYIHILSRASSICKGIFAISLFFTAVTTFYAFRFWSTYVITENSYSIEKIHTFFYICAFAVFVNIIAWLICILFAGHIDVYFTCTYFFYASFIASIINQVYTMALVDLEKHSSDIYLQAAFIPATKVLEFGALCAILWGAIIFIQNRKYRQANG